MTSSFELDRHWVPFGSNAAEGYSRDPKELQALEDVSCLVLLGVPGIGKTKELEKAAARARHKGRLVDFVSLGQLSEVTELEDRLLGGSNFRAWSDTGLAWVIFLDGLDEGLPQLPTLEPEIPRIFRQIGQRRQSLAGLHLRITCRLAEWPRSLEEQLKSIWPNSETQLFQLDDLNQEELRRAVGQMLTGDDARRFLTQVNERDALPLAVRPITLNMLLNIFQERSELPNLQVELYQRGLLASVEEANYLRRTKRRPGLLDNQSKLTICARIAAANLFSNKSEIWSGLQSDSSSKGWQDWKPRQIIGFITGLRPISRIRSRKEVFTGAAENVIAEDVPKAQLPDLADLSSHESIELPRTLQPVSPILRSFRILVVATEWGSAHGGLSTLNRNLCIALAGLGHEVACVVIDPSQRDIEEARASRIRLVEPPRVVTFNSEARLILYTASSAAGFVPEIVIGHDRITGPAAYHVAKDIYGGIPLVVFLHTIPEEIELFKSRSDGSPKKAAEKAAVQESLCKSAQLIVAVGPRILKYFDNRFRTPLVEFRPGLDATLLKRVPDLKQARSPFCLLLGRMEDGDLKGATLACQAIRQLNRDWTGLPTLRPRLIIRGFSPDFPESEFGSLAEFKEYVIYRAFSSDVEDVGGDINSASAVVMPSKREGFGLAALEAVAAGIPMLISVESGVAELLYSPDIFSSLGANVVNACIADVDGDEVLIRDGWVKRLSEILTKPSESFARAAIIREKLSDILTWERAARRLSEDFQRELSPTVRPQT